MKESKSRKSDKDRKEHSEKDRDRERDEHKEKKKHKEEKRDRYREEDWSFDRDRSNRRKSRSGSRDRKKRDRSRDKDRSRSRESREDRSRHEENHAWENRKVQRHYEGIQERKLIWSKSRQPDSADDTNTDTASSSHGQPSDLDQKSTAWTSRLAAATSDTNQINKFARLLGIKKAQPEGAKTDEPKVDEAQVKAEQERQKNLLEGLESQYEVAQSWSNRARGRGLGFSQ